MNPYKIIEILDQISECFKDIRLSKTDDYLPSDLEKLNELIDDLKREI